MTIDTGRPQKGLGPSQPDSAARAILSRRESIAAMAAAAASAASPASASATDGCFLHGVASGDPAETSVVLWTRVTTARAIVEVMWEVAEDAAFKSIVRRGSAAATAARDHIVKILVYGLEPDHRYHYRFTVEGRKSSPGRTRTLARGALDRVGIALMSCSNYALGYFNAYDAIAGDPSIDFLLHVGDYIYEYGNAFASQSSYYVRPCDPAHETVTLDDYRRRHAITKFDPQAQRMHAAHPLIALWDDHEFCNDAWRGGGQNHDAATEGDWLARRDAAVQAYYEWMPVREPEAGARLDYWRTYRFGDLATLVTLEARLGARDAQIEYGPYKARLKTDADRDAFVRDVLGDPDRQMLSEKMKAELRESLGRSAREKQPWRVVASPVVMARVMTPPLRALGFGPEKQPELAFLDKFTDLFWRSDLALPDSLDSWDGYAGARQEFYRLCREAGADDLVVLSGDSHAFWSNILFDDSGKSMGRELGTAGITSPSLYSLGRVPAPTIAAIDRECIAANSEVQWTDSVHRGYVRILLEREKGRADFVAVDADSDGSYSSHILRQTSLAARTEGSYPSEMIG